MTVESVNTPIVETGDGSTTMFTGPIVVNDSDVAVDFINSSGAKTRLSLNNDYLVSGSGLSEPVQIEIINNQYVPDYTNAKTYLSIYSDAPPVQLSKYPTTRLTITDQIIRSFDYVTILIQQLYDLTNRSLKFPTGDIQNSVSELPTFEIRKNTIIGFDTQGNIELINRTDQGLSPSADLPFWTFTDIDGINGDGILDDSIPINDFLVRLRDGYSGRPPSTGEMLILYTPGSSFYFKNSINVPSGFHLIFLSPIICGKRGGIRISGEIEEFPISNKYRLLGDVTAGDEWIFINTSPQNGGDISDHFVVNQRIILRGLADANNNYLEYQVAVIQELDDANSRVRISPNALYNFKTSYSNPDFESNQGVINRTLISLQLESFLTADLDKGTNWVSLTPLDVLKFPINSRVFLETDQITRTGESTNKEVFRVTDYDLTTNQIRLNCPVERDYTVADGARIVLLNHVENCSISGARVSYGEAADDPGPRTNAIEMRYADRCLVSDSDYDGLSNPTRGAALSMYLCQESGYENCSIVVSDSVDAAGGDNYGISDEYGNRNVSTKIKTYGCRYDALFKGSTNCYVELDGTGTRSGNVNFRGVHEVGCRVHAINLVGGNKSTVDANQVLAVIFGSSNNRGIVENCSVTGDNANVSGFVGTTNAVVKLNAGARNCSVNGLRSVGNYRFMVAADNDSLEGETEIIDFSISECHIEGGNGRPIDVDMLFFGGVNHQFNGLTIRDTTFRETQEIYIEQAQKIRFLGDVIFEECVATTPIVLIDCDDVVVSYKMFECQEGIFLRDCPDFIVMDARYIGYADNSIIFEDGGGNDGGIFKQTFSIGFTPIIDTAGGSTITYDPTLV